MNFIDIKELFSRIRFIANNLRYNSRKHFYLTTLCLVAVLVLIFTVVFIKQRTEIIRKENIVRSFNIEKEKGDEETKKEESVGNESMKGEKNGGSLLLGEEEVSTGEPVSLANDAGDKALYKVHICGEVYEPGVYDLEPGLCIADLIDLAGGATDSACLAAVNLAMEAGDGQRIYIPSFEEVEQGSSLYYGDSSLLYMDNSGNSGVGSVASNIININTAGTIELETLPGIGPATAKKIIDHRSKYGSFKSKEELMDISGIGSKKYEELEKLIRI
ncbi:helix-hairpin-helix domain-containing protein [Actinomycetota bacterium]